MASALSVSLCVIDLLTLINLSKYGTVGSELKADHKICTLFYFLQCMCTSKLSVTVMLVAHSLTDMHGQNYGDLCT